MSKNVPIGTIIESRPDGSTIYMSHRGILNLDKPELIFNQRTNTWSTINYLDEAIAEDRNYTADRREAE